MRNRLLGKNLLAIHVNYLAEGDAELLARRKVNVVHCPRSHAYFRHDRLALRSLLAAGVNICLGTDSLASVVKNRKEPLQLDLFSEMRALNVTMPRLSPETILEMATANGAKALGRAGQIGELTPGACADLIAIPFTGESRDATAAVVHHPGHVAASMIDGRWVVTPGANS
jgi:cytosine/adenosine deaminase-related metal-dependent hydrolase